MKNLSAIACCLVLLCACARQPSPVTPPQDGQSASQAWERYAGMEPPQEPYRLQLSLRMGEEGNTRRVTAIFWGNSRRHLRLDVMAGVGATLARILEDGEHFLVYSPGENKAYFYQGAARPLLRAGVPVPFNLGQLADLLCGRYAQVFGRDHQGAHPLKGGLAEFDLGEGRTGGHLTLNARGLPVAWREQGRGWRMEVLYTDDAAPLPRRLNLAHANGQRAVLLVKERERPAAPFTKEQLSLAIPDSTPLLPLSRYRPQQ